ncbi:MAG: hypothetical protein HRU19_32115 [Pseudobacteriovorax sp.]|nr:hypothetical protein [Pseudobacteriovorax sp.]
MKKLSLLSVCVLFTSCGLKLGPDATNSNNQRTNNPNIHQESSLESMIDPSSKDDEAVFDQVPANYSSFVLQSGYITRVGPVKNSRFHGFDYRWVTVELTGGETKSVFVCQSTQCKRFGKGADPEILKVYRKISFKGRPFSRFYFGTSDFKPSLQASIDINLDGVIDTRDYGLISFFYSNLDESEISFIIENNRNEYLSAESRRSDGASIYLYMQAIKTHLDLDKNGRIEIQDSNLFDLLKEGLDERELDVIISQYRNEYIGAGAAFSTSLQIIRHYHSINP